MQNPKNDCLTRIVSFAVAASFVTACASKPQIAVDPRTVANQAKYEQDINECTGVAENYDLTEGTAKQLSLERRLAEVQPQVLLRQ